MNSNRVCNHMATEFEIIIFVTRGRLIIKLYTNTDYEMITIRQNTYQKYLTSYQVNFNFGRGAIIVTYQTFEIFFFHIKRQNFIEIDLFHRDRPTIIHYSVLSI